MNYQVFQKLVAYSILISFFLSFFAPLQPVRATTSEQKRQLEKTSETTAITNVTLIDGTGREPQPNQTLVISNGRITDIFTLGRKKIPAGANVTDLSGKFVMPGLIDSHVHLMTRERPPETIRALLRFAVLGGVTSVRDMGGNGPKLAELKADFERGSMVSPRIYYSAVMSGKESRWFDGSYLSFASNGMTLGDAPWARAVTNEADVVQVVADAKRTGATAVKLYSHLPIETVEKLTAEARRQNLKVWSHPMKPSELVRAKVDSLSHAAAMVGEGLDTPTESDRDWRKVMMDALSKTTADSEEMTELLRLMKRENVVLDATLYIFALAAEDAKSPHHEWNKKLLEFGSDLTRRAKEMGVTVSAGTDAIGGSSPNLHAELQLLVKKSNFTPLEAITAATLGGARAIGVERDYGTLETGKVADLIILNENPVEDIRNTQTIAAVMQGGKIFRRDTPLPTPPLAEPPVSVRIRNVENGLLPAVTVKDKKNEMSLAERMRFYKTPAVSIAVVNNGVIEWARAYGLKVSKG